MVGPLPGNVNYERDCFAMDNVDGRGKIRRINAAAADSTLLAIARVDFEVGISRFSLFSKARRRARMFAIVTEAHLADQRPITFLGLQSIVYVIASMTIARLVKGFIKADHRCVACNDGKPNEKIYAYRANCVI